MINIIKERTTEEIIEHYILFENEENSGLIFEADCFWHPVFKCEAAKENYDYAMEHPEEYPNAWNERQERTRYYTAPAIGKCSCGNLVHLTHDDVQCEKCGKYYNIFGQELIAPEYREEF